MIKKKYLFVQFKYFERREYHQAKIKQYTHTYILYYIIFLIYRVIQEESARLQEMIVCVILSKKVHTNMGPILNGYGVMTA